jgi:hypothetical protein
VRFLEGAATLVSPLIGRSGAIFEAPTFVPGLWRSEQASALLFGSGETAAHTDAIVTSLERPPLLNGGHHRREIDQKPPV